MYGSVLLAFISFNLIIVEVWHNFFPQSAVVHIFVKTKLHPLREPYMKKQTTIESACIASIHVGVNFFEQFSKTSIT